MTRSALCRFGLITMALAAFQSAQAGSAVADDFHGHLGTAYGGPVEREKQRALEDARSHGAVKVRLIAFTDTVGYGAIAIARKGRGSVIGVALGRPSLGEADRLAIEACLRVGSANPQVRWTFRG